MKKLFLILVLTLGLVQNLFCYRIVCEKNITSGTISPQLNGKKFTYYFIVPTNPYLKYGQAKICYVELSDKDKQDIKKILKDFSSRTPLIDIQNRFEPYSLIGKVLTDITYKIENSLKNKTARVQDVLTYLKK